jgi:uncharacterized membrane protein
MNNFLKFLQVLALGTWVGSIFYFSAVVAPTAFGVLPSKDDAGLFVGPALSRLHTLGLIAAVVFVVAGVMLAGSLRVLAKPMMVGVILMVALTAISQNFVTHRMNVLRTDMKSVEKTPAEDPRRVEFDKLHSASVGLEGAVFLIGLASLFWTVKSAIPE